MDEQATLTYSQPIVHLVDDDEAVLDSLKILLDSLNINNATYSNGQELLNIIQSSKVSELSGCIVMDIRMPGMNGLDCQKALKALDCALPIIFLTGHGDIPMAVKAMKDGAVEFFQKPFREQELIDCIQNTIQQNVQTQHDVKYAREIERRVNSLSKRELEVMRRVISGQPNKTIAAELHLSQRTIEIHRANVMDKLQATSLAELVTMVLTQE